MFWDIFQFNAFSLIALKWDSSPFIIALPFLFILKEILQRPFIKCEIFGSKIYHEKWFSSGFKTTGFINLFCMERQTHEKLNSLNKEQSHKKRRNKEQKHSYTICSKSTAAHHLYY